MARQSRRRILQGSLGLAGFGLLAGCGILPPQAQAPSKVARIGYLGLGPRVATGALADAFEQGLRELGYVEGQNIAIEWRWAEGRDELLPALATELVGLNVDLLVASGPRTIPAARRATDTIPIVMVAGPADPVGLGLVASLARPGGNITGGVTAPPRRAPLKSARVAQGGSSEDVPRSRPLGSQEQSWPVPVCDGRQTARS